MSVNVMVFSGNAGSDMEVRVTPKGKSIGHFNVAVNSGWGDNKKTSWVTCKMFNERADKLAPYVKKGMLLTVSGELAVDEWEKDGIKNKLVCCIVNDVQLSAQPQAQAHNNGVQQVKAAVQDMSIAQLEDDLPF
jgi:single-strand DNA-binding protein